jgi:omega-6 fatty acid desaturase (delta-12 desaturase)
MTDLYSHSHSSTAIPTASLMVKYAPTTRSALYQFFTNFIVFFLSLSCLYVFRNNGMNIGVPLLTLSMVRTFIILHDCGHSSFSPNRQMNGWIGTFHGVLLCIPFSWSSHHYIHSLTVQY